MIDPGAGLASAAERWAARQAAWASARTAAQEKAEVKTALTDWWQQLPAAVKARLKAKILILEGKLDMTLAELLEAIYTRLSTRVLGEVMDWLC